jgi:hypothetical protein
MGHHVSFSLSFGQMLEADNGRIGQVQMPRGVVVAAIGDNPIAFVDEDRRIEPEAAPAGSGGFTHRRPGLAA